MHTFVSSSLGDYKHPEAAPFYSEFAVKKQWSANGSQPNLAICLPRKTTAGEKLSFNNQPDALDKGQAGIRSSITIRLLPLGD